MKVLDLDLRVSVEDFQRCIDNADLRMNTLMDVIERYNDAKRNLDQFIGDGDSNYQAMLLRIDENIRGCRKSYAALKKQKELLQDTLNKMEGMGGKVKETIESAIQATGSVINAALKIDDVL